MNAALASLNMEAATNLRQAQKKLTATQKKLSASSRAPPQQQASLRDEYIDSAPLPEKAADEAPSTRPVLRAPTE